MPLFGSQYGAQPPMASAPMPVQAPQAKRKRGLFGSAMDYLMADSGTPGMSRLATIGATLKDLGGVVDGGDTNNLMTMQQLAYKRQQDAAQQAWQQEQQDRQRQEWGRVDQQSQRQQEFINSVPEEDRLLAALGTEAYVEGVIDQRKPKTPEFGWRQNPDGTLEPIKGGPADPDYKQQVNPKAFVINTGNGDVRDSRLFSQGQMLSDDYRMQVKPYEGLADTGRLVNIYKPQFQKGQRDTQTESAILMKVVGGLQTGVLSDRDIATGSGGTLPTEIGRLTDYATGRGRLSAEQVAGLMRVAERLDVIAKDRVKGYIANVKGVAKARGIPEDYIFGVDPYRNMFGEDAAPVGPPQPAAPAPNALNSRGGSRSGQKVRVWNPATGRLE